ncbi:MAG: SRPBCC family protein [Acidimicrobiia bacterium]
MTDDVHSLRPVGLEFLESAPQRFEYQEPLAAPSAAVFAAISSDPSTWGWFPGIEEGSYEGDAPAGLGARRWVRIGGVKYRETMLAWDAPRRWAYRVDETSAPMFAALLEDWVTEPADGGTTMLHWTFAFEPLAETAELLVGAHELIGATFHDAARALDAKLARPSGPDSQTRS